jgi:hypothetical protein|tara:strand:- start:305 stop:547 length:243 start_codon:yes stop_codon:yes gene_type:complete
MKLTVNYPNLSPGAVVEIPGLGDFTNGEEHEVLEEVVEAAKARGYTFSSTGVYGKPLNTKSKSAKAGNKKDSSESTEVTE